MDAQILDCLTQIYDSSRCLCFLGGMLCGFVFMICFSKRWL